MTLWNKTANVPLSKSQIWSDNPESSRLMWVYYFIRCCLYSITQTFKLQNLLSRDLPQTLVPWIQLYLKEKNTLFLQICHSNNSFVGHYISICQWSYKQSSCFTTTNIQLPSSQINSCIVHFSSTKKSTGLSSTICMFLSHLRFLGSWCWR